MDEITIREAKLEDAEQIAKIHTKTWQCAYRGQLPDEFLDSIDYEHRLNFRKELLSSIQPAKTRHLVAEHGGKVVGFCDMGLCRDQNVSENSGEIYALYVDSNILGKGIGSKLLTEAIRSLKKFSFNQAFLWVLESNEKSRHFYEKNGWMSDGAKKTEKERDIDIHEIRYRIALIG